MSNMNCSDVTCRFCIRKNFDYQELLCNLSRCPDESTCKYRKDPFNNECQHLVNMSDDVYECSLKSCMYAD